MATKRKTPAPKPIPIASDIQIAGAHYKAMAIQPAEFSQKNNLNFLEGCVVKRMCRHGQKGGVEDLKKAIHEIRLIAEYQYEEQI